MYELCTDPEVIKYADTPVKDMQKAKQRLEQGLLISVFDIKAFQYEVML